MNWLFALLIFPLTLFLLIQNFGLEFVKRDYVKLALEFVFTGMLPLLIASLRREDWEDYGFTWVNWKRSVAYGLVLASPFMLIRVYTLLFLGYEGGSWSLNPLMLLAFLPVYGPLEAFFIVFSIVKIDKAFLMQRLMSKGLLLNSLFFGLMHTANYFFPSGCNFDLDKLRSIEYYPRSLRWSSIQEIQLDNWIFSLLDSP